MPQTETRLLLLRHGKVASHRADLPVTDAGLEHAELSGKNRTLERTAPHGC